MGDAQDEGSNTRAIGLGALLARAGLNPTEIEFLSRAEGGDFAFVMRSHLLQSLFQRGILQDYVEGSELDEKVFRAVASFPLDEQDYTEAAVQLQLRKLPLEQTVQLKSSLIAEGYNPEEPKVDARFLEWIRSANT